MAGQCLPCTDPRRKRQHRVGQIIVVRVVEATNGPAEVVQVIGLAALQNGDAAGSSSIRELVREFVLKANLRYLVKIVDRGNVGAIVV